jgi:hypothetical protein
VEACLADDLGMVQLPCPEQQAWGGVSKLLLLAVFALQERTPWLFRLRRLTLPVVWWYTRLRYRRLARRAAYEIKDYLTAGYQVVGVVGVDGSPSCGVHRGLDCGAAVECLGRLPLRALNGDAVNECIRTSVRDGPGLSTMELRAGLRRRQMAVPFFAHDLLKELDGKTGATVTSGKGWRIEA